MFEPSSSATVVGVLDSNERQGPSDKVVLGALGQNQGAFHRFREVTTNLSHPQRCNRIVPVGYGKHSVC